MKKYLIILSLFVSAISFGQTPNTTNDYIYGRLGLYAGVRDTTGYHPTRAGAIVNMNGIFYGWNGFYWTAFSIGGGCDTCTVTYQQLVIDATLGGGSYTPAAPKNIGADTINYIATKNDLASISNSDSGAITYIVDSIANAPLGTETNGTKYLVGTSPTGLFASHANAIATLTGGVWGFVNPTNNQQVIVDNATNYQTFQYNQNTTTWVSTSILWRVSGNSGIGQNAWIGRQDNKSFIVRIHNHEVARFTTDSTLQWTKFKNQDSSLVYFTVDANGKQVLGHFVPQVIYVDSVSTNAGGDSLIVYKNSVRYAYKLPSGGGGSTNLNIGSGFRWAVPNTNNIKTAFVVSPILLDSSTNTNALTYKFDTTVIHTSAYNDGRYLQGNQTITLSGDVSGSGTTAITTTIGNNKVTNAMLRQSAGLSVIGNSTNSTANVADITAGSDNQVLRRSGTAIGFGSIDLSQSNTVGSSILGATNGGTAQSTYTTGDILYASGTNTLSKLPIGTAKQTLHVVSGVPAWRDTAIGGGSSSIVYDSLTMISVQNWGILPTNTEAVNKLKMDTLLAYCITKSGYWQIYFPWADSAYKIRIVIPNIDSAHWSSISILGAVPPHEYYGTVGTGALPISGVILQSSDTTSGDAVIKATSANLDLWLRNLDIRTYDSTKISGVDAYAAAFFHMRDCFINTGVYNVQAKAPARTNTFGVRTPQINAGSSIELYNPSVSGFYTGIEINEHTGIFYGNILSCVRGITFRQAQHAYDVVAVSFQRNTYNFYIDPTVATSTASWDINIIDADIEHAAASQVTPNTAWQQTISDLFDSTNLATGAITWHTVTGGNGHDSTFSKNGGLLVQTGTHNSLQYLKYPITITSANAGVTTKAWGSTQESYYSGENSSGNYMRVGASTASNNYSFLSTDLAKTVYAFGGTGKAAMTSNGYLGLNGNISPANKFNIGTPNTADANADAFIYSGSSTEKNLVLQQQSGQQSPVLEWQNSDGSLIGKAFTPSSNTTAFQMMGQAANKESLILIFDSKDAANSSYMSIGSSGGTGYDGITNATNHITTNFNGSGTWRDFTIDGFDGSPHEFFRVKTTGVINFAQYSAGTVTIDGSHNMVSTSDQRLKHDIRPFRLGLNEIMKLHPSTFIYNKDTSNLVMPGFIAQDVIKAGLGVGANKGKDGYYSLNTNVVLDASVNAIQELKLMMDKQQKEIEGLKKEVKELKAHK